MATDLGQFLGGGGALKSVTYNAPGNFAVPANNDMVYVTATGGGGGGGDILANNGNFVAAGGNSGDAVNMYSYFTTAGSNIPITIGAGGPGGTGITTAQPTVIGNLQLQGGSSYTNYRVPFVNIRGARNANSSTIGTNALVVMGLGSDIVSPAPGPSNDMNIPENGSAEDLFGTRDMNQFGPSGAPGRFGTGAFVRRNPGPGPRNRNATLGNGISAAAGTGAGGSGAVSGANPGFVYQGGTGGSGRAIISYFG